jgi:hypothetical protein
MVGAFRREGKKRDKRWVEGRYILTELAVLYLREVMPLTREQFRSPFQIEDQEERKNFENFAGSRRWFLTARSTLDDQP